MSNFSSFPQYFFYLLLDFHVKAGARFLLRDTLSFEISEVEIRRVNCTRFSSGLVRLIVATLGKSRRRQSDDALLIFPRKEFDILNCLHLLSADCSERGKGSVKIPVFLARHSLIISRLIKISLKSERK